MLVERLVPVAALAEAPGKNPLVKKGRCVSLCVCCSILFSSVKGTQNRERTSQPPFLFLKEPLLVAAMPTRAPRWRCYSLLTQPSDAGPTDSRDCCRCCCWLCLRCRSSLRRVRLMNAVSNARGQTRPVSWRGVSAFVFLWLLLHHNGMIFFYFFNTEIG